MKKSSILVVYIIQTLLLVLYAYISIGIWKQSLEVYNTNYIIIDFVCNIILIVWIVFVCNKEVIKSSKEYQFSIKNILNRIWILSSTFLITLSANILTIMLLTNQGLIIGNQETLEELWQINKVLLSISAVCLVPIIEEVIFRWYLIGLFKKKKLYAVLVSSLAFAFMHCWIQMLESGIDGIIAMLPYFVTGLGLSIVYVRTKKIIYPIVFHILWNTMGILI